MGQTDAQVHKMQRCKRTFSKDANIFNAYFKIGVMIKYERITEYNFGGLVSGCIDSDLCR